MAKGRSREPRRSSGEQRRRFRRRDVGTRQPLPVFVVVCDDRVTAPSYFATLKRAVKENVTLRVVPCGGIDEAIGELGRLGDEEEDTLRVVPCGGIDEAIGELGRLGDEEEDTRDEVWVLMDLEREPHLRKKAEEEKARGEGEGIHVALSDPCYEVWTLMHLKDTGQRFTDCKQVTDLVRQCWRAEFGEKRDRKTHLDYGKIIGRRWEAVTRAKRHREANDQSWTEVYLVVERIDSVAERDAS